MDMSETLWRLVVAGVPLLAFPAALFWGLRRTLWGVLAVVALMLIGPPVVFAVQALWIGENPFAIFGSVVQLTWPALVTIGGWMVLWSLAYGGAGAAIRWGWVNWRRRHA